MLNKLDKSHKILNQSLSQLSSSNLGEIPRIKVSFEAKKSSADNRNFIPNWNSCYNYIESYFENTSVHGLRYVGDSNISFAERACWLLCFLMAFSSAGYFVSIIYVTYDENPVMITANPIPTPLSDIPFPTVTVCNMNKVKRSVAQQIRRNGTEVEKSILLNYCEKSSNSTTTQDTDEQSSDWQNVLKFILKASQSCQEMIKVCLWKSSEINCENWFNPTLTDEGLCCTFNQMPNSYIFRYRDNYNELSYNYPSLVEDWSQEKGYRKSAPNDVYPWRPAGPGLSLGLTLVLDGAVGEYYCSSTSSTGFKILMHNPMETPAVADFGRMVIASRESWFEIEPAVSETSKVLRSIQVKKRQCYFSDEKYLRFFKLYTQRNCDMECRTNYTINICGCVPYFLPRTGGNRICGFKDAHCTTNAEIKMQTTEVHDDAVCKCLPGCFELNFEKNGHYGLLHNSTVKKDLVKNMSREYFVQNAAIIHFYFYSPLLTKYIKRELYGFSEFLSNTGGLLGLFLGFSFLSAVELGYYLSLRIFCLVVRSKEYDETDDAQEKENDVIYPFVN